MVKSMKNVNDSTGNRTRDLPAFSAVPPRTPILYHAARRDCLGVQKFLRLYGSHSWIIYKSSPLGPTPKDLNLRNASPSLRNFPIFCSFPSLISKRCPQHPAPKQPKSLFSSLRYETFSIYDKIGKPTVFFIWPVKFTNKERIK